MDRNREARRQLLTNAVTKRRHRSTSLRDSPEEEETSRLRTNKQSNQRPGLKQGDRTVRIKRRRNESNSSEGSVNGEDESEDEQSMLRMLPPGSNNNNTSSNKGFVNNNNKDRDRDNSGNKDRVFKPVQGWKPADEMIGFSVPRKARSASKRSIENWNSGAGATPENNLRRDSLSPSTAPLSPSSSNVSVRKKIKTNGTKQKPPKSSSKASSSNPEELEIEIAEVLYGLMTQSQAPPPKNDSKSDTNRPNNSINETKSRVSSPISNSAPLAPQNSSSSTLPITAIPSKRKRPKQPSNNHRTITPIKSETDQPRKIEALLPNQEKKPENKNLSLQSSRSETVESPLKEIPAVKPEDLTKTNSASSVKDVQREEKLEIDLMAPPHQMKSSPERESENEFEPVVSIATDAEMRTGKSVAEKEIKESKNGNDEMLVREPELKKAKSLPETAESERAKMIKERNIDLQLDLEKPDRDNSDNLLLSGSKSLPLVQKQQQPQVKVAKDEQPPIEKTAQSSSMPLQMPLASWPGGHPPTGYMAPLQGVVSMDGSQVTPTPVQPMFSQPRPKRCATHYYIAQNIHYLQQFMKMNPFWPTSAGPASLVGVKPSNLSVVPPTELQGRALSSVQDKGQGLAIFPGHGGKEKASQPANVVDSQRKQQPVLLQQALPPGAPSNMMHGPAFIFPFNQHQTAAALAAASVRPGLSKSPSTAPNSIPVSASTSTSVNGSAAAAPTQAAVSFNYPNMPTNETQYLAIMQNNAYPFPIPAPAYRGNHPQPIPFFNGSFYTSQMIHPSQLQQQPASQPQQQMQSGQPNPSISSGSSTSQKQHLQSQQQQRPPQGTGNPNAFPAPKARPAQSSQPRQARNIEIEVGHEDSPSSADSRSTRGPVGVYGQNVSMPIHHQNFALVSPTQALAGNSNGSNAQGENKKQQSQQQGSKSGGVESYPQTFAMSFASMNGGNTAPGGIDLSSVAQNHAVYQNFSEADRRNYQVMQAAALAQASQQRKNFRASEDSKSGAGGSSSNVDEDKKSLAPKASVSSGQSIAFTRPDLSEPAGSPLTGANVIDSSARNLNLASSANNQRGPPRNSITNNSQLGQLQNMQFQQQHIQQQMANIQKQQQQLQQQFSASQNNKTQPGSNGNVYGDHLAASSPSGGPKFPNTISVFPQNLVHGGGNNSPSHSPQWKNSTRGAPQVQSVSTSSLKNIPQQQQARPQQSHTQISFGSGQKPQMAPQGPQPSTHQAASPPMRVGSPTTSLSKGASGSPRAASSNSQGNKASSLSSQQSKNPASVASLKTPSILGNPHNIASSNSVTKSVIQQQQQQQQQQLQQHQLQQQQLQNHQQQQFRQQQLKQMGNHQPQPQLFFSPAAYMQGPSLQSSSNPGNTSGYYLQKRYPEKQQQQQQGGSPSGTSAGMLSLCTPVTQATSGSVEVKSGGGSTSTNMKGPPGMLHHPQFQAQPSGSFSYSHTLPAGVQAKPTTEQKQSGGNREPLTRK